MGKRAIILAGGKGTRLKPYTISLPKPLVPIGDVPILEIIIRQLKKAGFNHVTLTVNHMADIIQAYFGDGSKWGITIDYSLELKPLSTMGPLTLIPDLPEDFLVMNGDILTDLNFEEFYDAHISNKSNFTIASYLRKDKVEYGVLIRNENAELIQFQEKPENDYLVSMGVYMMSKKNVDLIPIDTFFGFDHLMNVLIEKKQYPKIHEFNGYWLDIGRPADYEKAIEEHAKMAFL
ncbi:NTP transferase domain-containing protein [Aquirufa ecclesiirivi]|uniref:NTP transferase domain-containing protein n=1 Tax=Aquirufa ecclesiirivi TaxID=2715124 RepID=A0ABT4JGQ4_9BACT|nr:sugar phosphate nucleotidyltransferase [Aquirufa ecclesiirivi]MCZ2475118.1 NTP transferase domain-containing protein [Aquirufa ecclesiirivi]MDF0692466.1 sugar phosphate nucleotidyltransferase [Aquirufa ecclesiirivi]